MASIVVCGGSVIGLTSAMLLARQGHDVTVLERDPAPPPAVDAHAWDDWDRKGVAQFHQPHNLFPRFRQILDEDLPGITDRLVEAGCVWMDPIALLPPSITDREPRPGDDRFRFVTGRRPVVESALARAAGEHPGVTVRRGVGVTGLLTGSEVVDGVPHVTGVTTTTGQELAADLVVDATGRRTKLAEWVAAVGGGDAHVESEDCGFVYHTRYFTGPRMPRIRGPIVSEIGTVSLLTMPGDNATWSVTVWAASSDTALKKLRHTDRFTRLLQACPLHAHWVRGEPITDVLTMAGILDRYRRFVVDGRPVATGVVAVGDAWACTNPSAGQGITVGVMHARCLGDVLQAHGDDPAAFALAFDEATEATVTPYYRKQIRADRARIAAMDALREGRQPPAPDPDLAAASAAMVHDPDVFRGMLEAAMCLALPEEVFARPGFRERIEPFRGADVWQVPGPDRAALLDLVG